MEGSALLSKTHNQLQFRVPDGVGHHTIVLSVRGNVMARGTGTAALTYAPPEVYSVTPGAGAVDGGTRIVIKGRNFHVSPTDTSLAPVDFASPGLPIPMAAILPTALLRVDMHRGCVGEGRSLAGGVPRPLESCSMTVLSRSHTEIVLLSAPGIGVNRTLNVSFIEPDANGATALTTASSPPFPWAFEPPTIVFPIPQLVVSRGEDSVVDLAIVGDNYGRTEDAVRDGWTAEETALDMAVAGVNCSPPPTRGSRGGLQIIQCSLRTQTAGPKNVTLVVAGQPAFMSAIDANAPTVVCDHGFTGRFWLALYVCECV